MEEIIEVENRFYILADSSLVHQPTLVIKRDAAFAVLSDRGDVEAAAHGEQGLFHEGTRFLSRLELRVNGERPMLLSSALTEDNARVVVDLTNPDIRRNGVLSLERGDVHIHRSRFLWERSFYERLTLSHFGMEPVEVDLSLAFDSDFADIFEVRGMKREKRGEKHRPRVGEKSVEISYDGLDGVTRTSRVEFEPAPERLTGDSAHFRIRLEPNARARVYMTVRCTTGEQAAPGGTYRGLAGRIGRGAECGARCILDSSNRHLKRWVDRSWSDVRMLLTRGPQGDYPYAGIPWYSAIFGRDGIITALQLLWVDAGLARAVLATLAALQSQEEDPHRDAEPGKILHERRVDEMAATGEIPFGSYYGTADATPLFVVLAGAYYHTTGDREFVRRVWPSVERALEWIDRYGDLDGDGFVEYRARTVEGLTNQGWKDSHDSIFHADGRLAQGPIALCEVQGYVYDAKMRAAELARALGRHQQAGRLIGEAHELKRRFNEAFWSDELGMYALALDGEKRPCLVRASNCGHCLYSGIADAERSALVAEALTDPGMYSGWGIRTVGAGESRYNPMSYHNGSLWPHDNAIIAAGLARYGHHDAALKVLRGWLDASVFFELHRLPELCCGFARRAERGPTLYPVACSPQAWAAGAVFMFLGASLGLTVEGTSLRVRVRHARLPRGIDEIRLSGLSAGGSASVDLLFTRHKRDVGVFVLGRRGQAEVVVET